MRASAYPLLEVDDAASLVLDHVPVLGLERVALAHCIGRVLAERGHEVAWVGPESYLRPLVGPDVAVGVNGNRAAARHGSSSVDRRM